MKTGALGAMKTKWAYDACKVEALKYKYKSEFEEKSSSAYNKIMKNGWLELCSHMKRKKSTSKWSFEKCKEEALKYNTRSEFQIKSRGAYKAAWRNGWLDEFFPKK